MKLTRRNTLIMGGAAAIFTPLMARAEEADAVIEAFTGGAEMADAGVELTTPEIAENGNTVPVEAAAEGATSIILIATANPESNVATATFGEASGASRLSTRIRLAGTQEVIAIAKMADGSFAKASKEVKVTIGGCGG